MRGEGRPSYVPWDASPDEEKTMTSVDNFINFLRRGGRGWDTSQDKKSMTSVDNFLVILRSKNAK